MKMLPWVLSWLSVNDDANIANRKDCTKCPNNGGRGGQMTEKCKNT